MEKHRGAGNESRVLVEYRMKVIGLLEHLGPDVSRLQFMLLIFVLCSQMHLKLCIATIDTDCDLY